MASKTTDLKIDVQEGASWSRKLSITVPAERVRRTRGRVVEQVTKGMRLPGFRKGKLPARVVEQRFGPSIDQETLDRLIQEAYKEALEAEGLTPIAQGRVDDVKYEKDQDLVFQVELEVRPEIELARLNGFTVARPSITVGEEEVDSVLERLRDERGEWVPLEPGARPDYGDQVLVEITALDKDGQAQEEEGRAYRIVLGEDQAIPDVEAAILTLAEGESSEFDVSFPDDFPDEERRGQVQKLRIAVQETRKKVLPELNDEFAKSVGEFESLEALRERILSDLQEDANERAEAEVRGQLIDQILEANPFDPPPSMVETYLQYMMGEGREGAKRPERSPEEEQQYAAILEGLRPQAIRGLKRTLVVERIAEQEGLRASQDEIDERVETIAARHNRSPSEVWIQLEKAGQLEVIEREITEQKVFDFLKSQSTIA